jgi:hypothetical protein
MLAAVVPDALAASPAPDLSLRVQGPSAVGLNAPFTDKITVTNQGTATAPGVTVSYSTGGPFISPSPEPGMYCVYIERGHSGRGGGSTTVGDSCSETLSGGLAPGQSAIVRLTKTEPTVQSLSLTFATSPYPFAAQLDLVSHTRVMPVSVIRPPAAAAPAGVKATESGDQLNVRWKPATATAPYISASVVTATPMGGSTAPVLTAVTPGTATRGAVPGVLASTTYAVTVANNDGGGAGAPSHTFLIKTQRATERPGKPVITYAWGYVDIRWNAPSAGNSAIDQYEVLATGGGNKLTSYVSGAILADYLAPQPSDSLAVTVRAHNAAGWGKWSVATIFTDGGGG